MQPDTTPLKMAQDINDRLSGQRPDPQPANDRPQTGEPQETNTRPTNGNSVAMSQIQVIPLYNPEGSAIKFFCVHPSHRYALSLMPISSGFQGQVKQRSHPRNSILITNASPS